MLAVLMDAGPVLHDGSGQRPLDWRDARAYGQCTDAISEPWEFRTLCRMSLAYLREFQLGQDAMVMPPNERDGG